MDKIDYKKKKKEEGGEKGRREYDGIEGHILIIEKKVQI